MTELPSELWQISQLEELSLYGNKLATLPEKLASYPVLLRWTISKNLLTSLPIELWQLYNLSFLLANNKLNSIPSEIGQLINLEYLDLSDNKLTTLPTSMKGLQKLKSLDLREKQLAVPPEILDKIDDPQSILNYFYTIISVNQKSYQ